MFGVALLVSAAISAPPESFDVVIYGGTSAGVIAAVQAVDDGLDVVVVAPEKHLGGLTAGGLGWTDSGRKEAIGGLSRDFYRRIGKHYDDPSAWRQQTAEEYGNHGRFRGKQPRSDDGAYWVFEPHVAEQVFEDLVAERKVNVVRDEWLDRENGVVKEDGKIVSIKTLSGKRYRGKIFMDATYEGDLLAAAGISYIVGRESNDQYGETINGIQVANADSHQFPYDISPYVKPGDPTSGLLPNVRPGDPPGPDGAADNRPQAYNFRMCNTDDPSNRVPWPKPTNYNALNYELLARVLDGGWRGVWNKFDPAPNRKTDTNNHGPFSTDYIGKNYDYPEATYEERKRILKEHEDYQKGLMWFLANDPRVPEDVRNKHSKWGLAKDEFVDNGHWPHQAYIREARRMIGEIVVGERHLRGFLPTEDSVGMGSYNMDSHNTQRYVTAEGFVRNEGDVQINPGGPYPISYRALTPKKAECENLLVPVCCSTSHIAYGSVRMEPVFMILGQSAAVAAKMAIDAKSAVQDVPYAELKVRLEELGQVLDLPNSTIHKAKPIEYDGIVLDDTEAKFTSGEWRKSGSVRPFVGFNYQVSKDPGAAAVWEYTFEKGGKYSVELAYSANPNRAKVNVHFDADFGNGRHGKTTCVLDQTEAPTRQKTFQPVKEWNVNEGTKMTITVERQGGEGEKYLIIDAIRFVAVD